MKVSLLPIDDRPVTYLWPQVLARVAGVQVDVPPRAILGSLERLADSATLTDWITQQFAKSDTNAHLMCVDSVLYGGLIPSRRSAETQEEVEQRLHNVFGKPKPIRKGEGMTQRGRADVFAQSSIMRISDNYDATEEKKYWERYGREIFAWSEIMHRLAVEREVSNGRLEQFEAKVPAEIRADYLQTRRRNFSINKQLVEYVPSQKIQRLVFSQDDSGAFGLNVLEKERLLKLAQSLNVQEQVALYAGADEVLGTLLAYALIRFAVRNGERKPKCAVLYTNEDGGEQISRYEGQKISDSVASQLKACGIGVAPNADDIAEVDFVVIVHTSETVQGDHITLPGLQDLSNVPTKQGVETAIDYCNRIEKPLVICDVAYANGSDPQLVDALLDSKNFRNVIGYAGWNTTGNTIGSALALAVARWFATSVEHKNDLADAHKEALFIRLMDDWAYQTAVRKQLNGNADPSRIAALMQPYAERVTAALGIKGGETSYVFPWNRTFEIEIVRGGSGA